MPSFFFFFFGEVLCIFYGLHCSITQPQITDSLELKLEKQSSENSTLNSDIYWDNLVRKHSLWNSSFTVDIINHNSITEELMDVCFIVSCFIIASQFCIPNVMLICFSLAVGWLIDAALWKKAFYTCKTEQSFNFSYRQHSES